MLSKRLCKTTLFPFNLLWNGPQGMCLLLFIPVVLQYCFFCMSHLSGLILTVSDMTIFAFGTAHSQVWQNELLWYSVSWDLTPSFQRVTASYSTEVVRGGEEERERKRENNLKNPTKPFVSLTMTKQHDLVMSKRLFGPLTGQSTLYKFFKHFREITVLTFCIVQKSHCTQQFWF